MPIIRMGGFKHKKEIIVAVKYALATKVYMNTTKWLKGQWRIEELFWLFKLDTISGLSGSMNRIGRRMSPFAIYSLGLPDYRVKCSIGVHRFHLIFFSPFSFSSDFGIHQVD